MNIAKHVRRISPRTWFFFRALRYKFYNGEPEIWLARHCLKDRALAIDIGASIGFFSRELAKSAARVIAFEANPRLAEFAKSVAPPNVTVEGVALSSSNRDMTLRIPLNPRNDAIDDLGTIEPKNTLPTDAVITKTIMARRLDDYGYADCGFIKLDVEGHEEDVLDGGARLIERCRPILLIELEDRFNPGIVRRVRERLGVLGYAAYQLQGGRLHALGPELPNHPVSYNLLFVPNEAKVPVLPAWDRLGCAIRSRFRR